MEVFTGQDYKAKNSVLMFSGEFCMACRTMKPSVLDMEKTYQGVSFFYVDAESNPELVNEFQVSNLPTLVFLRGGTETSIIRGAVSKKKLQEEFTSVYGG